MIEGKECKEQLEVKKKALQAADAAKNELRNSNSILNGNLGDLKNALANAEANAADYKKVAKNEKARNLRTGFFGFVAGGLTTLVLFLTIR